MMTCHVLRHTRKCIVTVVWAHESRTEKSTQVKSLHYTSQVIEHFTSQVVTLHKSSQNILQVKLLHYTSQVVTLHKSSRYNTQVKSKRYTNQVKTLHKSSHYTSQVKTLHKSSHSHCRRRHIDTLLEEDGQCTLTSRKPYSNLV